jgi:hypothetical protein
MCLAEIIIAMTFFAEIRRGMDHLAAFDPESE